MALEFPLGFKILTPEPVEVKMVSLTLAVRNAISLYERYVGLWTYCIETDTFYYLKGGIENTNWEPIAKPASVEILDVFSDEPQTIISGQGLKAYLETNYATKNALAEAIESVRVGDHIRGITPEQINQWNALTGDFRQKINFPEAEWFWIIPHPPGNKKPAIECYLPDGKRIYGQEISTETETRIAWGRPFSGFAELN